MRKGHKAPRTKGSNVWQITTGKEAGRWSWEVELTRSNGEKYRRAGSRKTEAEAKAARDKAYDDFNRSGGTLGRQYTVRSWCEYCLSGGLTNQRKKTLGHYKGWLQTRVYPILGPVRLHDLQVDQIQLFLQGLQETDVASAAVRVRTALNACLTLAVEQGHLDRHVGRLARIVTNRGVLEDDESETPGKRILTREEQEKLLKGSEGTRLYMPTLLGLRFGLRFGECCGLKWDDVDLDKGIIRVRRQVQQVPEEGKQYTPLKTGRSKRDLPIPTSLLPIFRERAEQARAQGQNVVCPNEVGEKMTPQEGSVPFKRLCKRLKINEQEGKADCTHHDLRSTFLTFMANEANGGKGVRPSTLMAIAGHGKIDTTYRFYIRSDETDMREAMEFVA